jgi:hypothetical protein
MINKGGKGKMKKRLALVLGVFLLLLSPLVIAENRSSFILQQYRIDNFIPRIKGDFYVHSTRNVSGVDPEVHIIVKVQDERGSPIAGVTVDLFNTQNWRGNAFIKPHNYVYPADVSEIKTKIGGYTDEIVFLAWDTWGTTPNGTATGYGSYITVRTYSTHHRQTDQFASFFAKDDTGPGFQNYINYVTITMQTHGRTPLGRRNTIYGVGLRESLYGLTKPYGDMVPYKKIIGHNRHTHKPIWRTYRYMRYPNPTQTMDFVQHLRERVNINDTQPQKNIHVVIVTQTDPGTFTDPKTNLNETWGPTYLLWNRTDLNSGAEDAPANVKFLDDVRDLYGRQFDNYNKGRQSWYGIDQILYSYDFDPNAEVYLQIEPGNADIAWLLKTVYNRFCNRNPWRPVHPCIAGFGIDTEWYKNVDPFAPYNDEVVIDTGTGNWLLGLIKALNPQMRLFLKHFAPAAISNQCAKDIIYVDDTQGNGSLLPENNFDPINLSSAEEDYASWASAYSPADIVFQGFYDSALFETCHQGVPDNQRSPRDSRWWGLLNDPLQDSFTKLFDPKRKPPAGYSKIAIEPARQYGVVWVDFSARSNFKPLADSGDKVAQTFQLDKGVLKTDVNDDLPFHVTPPPFDNPYHDKCSSSTPTPPPIPIPPPDPDDPSVHCNDSSGICPNGPSPWAIGETYQVDDLVIYDDMIWICLQAHTVYAADWCPGLAPSLWEGY